MCCDASCKLTREKIVAVVVAANASIIEKVKNFNLTDKYLANIANFAVKIKINHWKFVLS